MFLELPAMAAMFDYWSMAEWLSIIRNLRCFPKIFTACFVVRNNLHISCLQGLTPSKLFGSESAFGEQIPSVVSIDVLSHFPRLDVT